MRKHFIFYFTFLFSFNFLFAHTSSHIKVVQMPSGRMTFDTKNGTIDYAFSNGISLKNTVAYVDLIDYGVKVSSQFERHSLKEESIKDSIGEGMLLRFIHEDHEGITLVQSITI